MKKASFDKIYNDVTKELDSKLPSYFTYHCTGHTKYVVERVAYIAKKEKVKKSDIFLLKIAALYHDIGFIIDHIDHEEKGCAIAKKELPGYGFEKEEIKKICGMIMATKIPQDPKTDLEKIIADADLEYLATKEFKRIGETLLKELRHFNPKLTRKEWDNIQVKFMEAHLYHTNYCRRYKEHRKRKNLQGLK